MNLFSSLFHLRNMAQNSNIPDDNNSAPSPPHLDVLTGSQNDEIQLTHEQLSRMDKNRKRALDIKKTKESQVKVYAMVLSYFWLPLKSLRFNVSLSFRQKLMEKDEHKKLIDTGAGFYLDEEDLEEEIRKETQIFVEPCKFFFSFQRILVYDIRFRSIYLIY